MSKPKAKPQAGAQAIEQLPTASLIPYARNARTHSEEQVTQIAASIREFGFNNPVLIDTQSTIIAGHGRVMAAGKLGLESVPCIRLTHLTDAQRRAYVLADNRIALNSGWDSDLLAIELGELGDEGFDLGLLGFGDEELQGLLGVDEDSPNFQPGLEEDQGQLDRLDPKMVTCPNCGGEFDSRKHGKD
jgi:ParB-like chromosome segregation protein Spo0J